MVTFDTDYEPFVQSINKNYKLTLPDLGRVRHLVLIAGSDNIKNSLSISSSRKKLHQDPASCSLLRLCLSEEKQREERHLEMVMSHSPQSSLRNVDKNVCQKNSTSFSNHVLPYSTMVSVTCVVNPYVFYVHDKQHIETIDRIVNFYRQDAQAYEGKLQTGSG